MFDASGCRASSTLDLFFDTPTRGDFPDPIPLPDSTPDTRASRPPSTPALRNFSYPSGIIQQPTPTSPTQSSVTQSRTSPILRTLQPLTPIPTPTRESPGFLRSLGKKNKIVFTSAKGLFDPRFSIRQTGNLEDQDSPPRKKRRSVLSILSASQVHTRLFSRRASSASTAHRKPAPSPERTVRRKKSLSDLVSHAAFTRRKRPPAAFNQSQVSLGYSRQALATPGVNLKRPTSSSSAQPYRPIPTPESHRRAKSASVPIAESAKLDMSASMSPSSSESTPNADQGSGYILPAASQASYSSSSVLRRDGGQSGTSKVQRKNRKSKWLSSLKEWVTASEPSTEALKQHRQETFKNAGVAVGDLQAHARIHSPIGTIPDDAIKPAGPGPEPEQVARKRADEKKKKKADPYGDMWTEGPVSQTSSDSNRSGSGSSFAFLNFPSEK